MLSIVRGFMAVAAGLAVGADARTVCGNATWSDGGRFYTFWHDTGSACMTVDGAGGYRVEWRLGERGNLVVGQGWRTGRTDRVVRYRAARFDPGSNGYLSLYGWSTRPLVEYYVVENWGGFVPPGPDARLLGTLTSDGGTYRVYRTRRIDQPSIAGRASFDQYWSVRTERKPAGAADAITFANHVSGWRRLGLRLGRLDYQVLATEGFGSSGRAEIAVGR